MNLKTTSLLYFVLILIFGNENLFYFFEYFKSNNYLLKYSGNSLLLFWVHPCDNDITTALRSCYRKNPNIENSSKNI